MPPRISPREARAAARGPAQSPSGRNAGIQRESWVIKPNIIMTPKTTSSAPAVTWMAR